MQPHSNSKINSHRVASNSRLNRSQKGAGYGLNRSQQSLAAEIIAKLLINGLLSVVAIASLAKLFPLHQTQEAKLLEVRNEVKDTQNRVNRLEEKFSRNFDPKQTQSIVKTHSPKLEPTQIRVFWLHNQEPSKP